MSFRTVSCPLHGVISLTERMCLIIDTPEFQRLHRLKQLGLTQHVYPSATHTRFEHSLGVSHLAKVLVTSLKEKGLDIDSNMIELYQIAGLIHDIGHGPFSHLYDDEIINPGEPKHEERGINIFFDMLMKYNLPFIQTEVDFIVALIEPCDIQKNNWMYQIINNKFCSIDVDKIDYIQRDCYHLGFGINQKFERLVTMCEVKSYIVEGKTTKVLAWPEKLEDETMSLFEARYWLHKRVYCHHTVKAIEYIVIDILKEIMKTTDLKLEELHDDIIWFPFKNATIKSLQLKMSLRQHPKLICEKIITVCEGSDKENKLEHMKSVLDSCNISHLGIKKTKIGFISGNGINPLINVPYFTKGSEMSHKQENYSSFMAPKNCQEYVYRIYTQSFDRIVEARHHWKEITEGNNGRK